MKTKTLAKKLYLKKNTVSNLELNEVKGGYERTDACPPYSLDGPCLGWTLGVCITFDPNCMTNENSNPCC